jgi:amidohydrolase
MPPRRLSASPPVLSTAIALRARLVAWRRRLHAHPEPSLQEAETAKFVAAELRRLGVAHVRTGVGGHGVTALVGDPQRGPTVALRADMDALELTEATGATYASKRPGLMHACGHDGHVAGLLGAAALLTARAADLPGAVRLLFQPAEESGGGARRMIDDGCLVDPPVRAAAALHLFPHVPSGQVGIRRGVFCAQSDSVAIAVRGRSAHAARPQTGVDAIAVAAHLITAIQAYFDRRLDPLEPHLLTIGRIEGGTRLNILAGEVRMQGTLRTLTPAMRRSAVRFLTAGLPRIAAAFDAQVDVVVNDGYPPVVNDDRIVDCLERAAADVVGQRGIHPLHAPSLGGEDFAYYGMLGRIPIAMCRLGTFDKRRGFTGMLHSTTFDFDDGRVLPVAAALLAQTAVEVLAAVSA